MAPRGEQRRLKTLRHLKPGHSVSVRVIFLGRRHIVPDKPGVVAPEELWIADETASASLLLHGRAGTQEKLLSIGEIFEIDGAEACLNRDQRLVIAVSGGECISRVGFLTLPFQEEPDVSAKPWTAPARQNNKAVDQDAAGDDKKSSCFLCASTSHPVHECPDCERALIVKCAALEDTKVFSDRLEMLQKALRTAGLPQVERCHWYKKSAAGVLYVTLGNDTEANVIFGAKDLVIKGRKASIYRISAPGADGNAVKGKTKGSGKASDRERQGCNNKGIEGATVDGGDGTPALRASKCFLCGATEHVVYDCPDSERGVVFVCKAIDAFMAYRERNNLLKEALQKAELPMPDRLYWYFRKGAVAGFMYARFAEQESAARCLKYEGLKINDVAVEIRPSILPPRPEHNGRDAGRNTSIVSRKACFLCGEQNHELPKCPVRTECVLLTRDWGVGDNETVTSASAVHKNMCAVLEGASYKIRRTYWHKKVCYMRLASAEDAKQLLDTVGLRGLSVGGETLRLRPARSTKSDSFMAGGTRLHKKSETSAKAKEDASAPCALCGADDHAVATCSKRSCGALVACPCFEQCDLEAVQAELTRCAETWEIEPPLQMRLGKAGLYVTLANEEDQATFIMCAVGEGLELQDQPASVEPLDKTSASASKSKFSRAAGLRPADKGGGSGPRGGGKKKRMLGELQKSVKRARSQ